MKRLDQFFESEDDRKVRPTKKNEGKDDKKFIALMDQYKMLRRQKDRTESAKVLKQALELSKEGDVSDKAKMAAAYL